MPDAHDHQRPRLHRRRLAVAAAMFAAFAPAARGYTVEIDGGAESCFGLDMVKGGSFSGNFEILTPDFDLSAIDVKVSGPPPRRTEHYRAADGELEEGSFTVEAADGGHHTLCMRNSGAAAATIGFAFRQDEDVAAEVATEENVNSMVEVANEMTQGLDMLSDHQEFMRVREDGHRATVLATNAKVLWWSVAEAAVLAAMAFWQVLYIRTFFETKRSI